MSNSTITQSNKQYSLAKILGIWAAAALPMAILSWVIYPALAPDLEANPLGAGVTRMNIVWSDYSEKAVHYIRRFPNV